MFSPTEAIKSKLSIADVVGSYLKLEKAGVNYKARCPFHNERTPSFFVSPARGSFHCFGCNKGGDMFSFVEEIEGVEFREALKTLAERAGVDLSAWRTPAGGASVTGPARLRKVLEAAQAYYQGELARSEQALAYLAKRGLEPGTIEKFKLGFAPAGWRGFSDYAGKRGVSQADAEQAGLLIKGDKGYYDRFRNRVMFPFFDYSGRIIGFSGRIMPGSAEEATAGKYINSPETPLFSKSRVFYCLDQAKNSIRETGLAVLVEGQLDALLAHQVGSRNVLAVSGTALTGEHLKAIRRLSDHLVMVLDGDEAGFRASSRGVRLGLAADLRVSVVPLPAGADPADIVKQNPQKWLKLLENARPFVTYALEMIKTNFERSEDRQKAVREYLYPGVFDMYNEIEKDSALQAVAALLEVSAGAVRLDYQKWLAGKARPVADSPDPADADAEAEATKPAFGIRLVASRLWGISMAFPDFDSRQRLEEMLGRDLFDRFKTEFEGPKRADLIFAAESYHPEIDPKGERLKSEIELLTRRLSKELLKERFVLAMDDLRRAESKGDKEAVVECLRTCQVISRDLNLA